MTLILSDAEHEFIEEGVACNCRCDGRTRTDYRHVEVGKEEGLLPSCFGASEISIGDTKVLVGVHLELQAPEPNTPDEGSIECSVYVSPSAVPQMRDRNQYEDLSYRLTQSLQNVISCSHCIQTQDLCIKRGLLAWKIFVNCTVMACDGNILDASVLGAKLALKDTFLPRVVINEGKSKKDKQLDYTVSEDPYDSTQINGVDRLPTCVSLHVIGKAFIADATWNEELCSEALVQVSLFPGGKVSVDKLGRKAVHPTHILAMIEQSKAIAKKVNTALETAVADDD